MTKLCHCLFTAIILIAYSSPTLADIKQPKAPPDAPSTERGTGTNVRTPNGIQGDNNIIQMQRVNGKGNYNRTRQEITPRSGESIQETTPRRRKRGFRPTVKPTTKPDAPDAKKGTGSQREIRPRGRKGDFRPTAKPTTKTDARDAKKGTIKLKTPTPPPDAPDAVKGTGSRSSCSLANYGIVLTPLIPQSAWGYTASQTPVVWVHISYENNPSNLLSGELSVLDKQGNLIKERQKVEIPNTSGAFSLQLAELPQSNQRYDWILEIECGNNQYISVRGYIYQQQFDNLIKLKPEERISFYLEKGIWYDVLNEAANLYCQDSRFWQELLTQEKLELALKEPIKCSQY
ncbi:MAG: DUF928 domain-containing protein [Aphanizomenon gracile PMC627.10]|nr:DUF928 domain-containing protein [Aphanizomenon gracile PMC627.10]